MYVRACRRVSIYIYVNMCVRRGINGWCCTGMWTHFEPFCVSDTFLTLVIYDGITSILITSKEKALTALRMKAAPSSLPLLSKLISSSSPSCSFFFFLVSFIVLHLLALCSCSALSSFIIFLQPTQSFRIALKLFAWTTSMSTLIIVLQEVRPVCTPSQLPSSQEAPYRLQYSCQPLASAFKKLCLWRDLSRGLCGKPVARGLYLRNHRKFWGFLPYLKSTLSKGVKRLLTKMVFAPSTRLHPRQLA